MEASQIGQAEVTSPDLLEVLRSRTEQARAMRDTYRPAHMAQDTMLYWLAKVAKDAREAAGRKQVHIAAEIDRDQSAVYRFEQGLAWPRDVDLLVAGYAADLDISPMDIWDKALQMWREQGSAATVEDLAERRETKRRKTSSEAFGDVFEDHDSGSATPASSRASKKKTQAAR